MHIIQQILFVAFAGFAVWLFAKNIGIIRRNIFLGKAEDLNNNSPLRWKNLLLLAFGQKKMFRNPLVAVMHFIIYAGFIIINLEVLEIAVCLVFVIRINVIKIKRFISKDLAGWPHSDANYILITEIILMTLFITMNSADRALQLQGAEHYHQTGDFIFSGLLAPLFSNFSASTLIGIERT